MELAFIKSVHWLTNFFFLFVANASKWFASLRREWRERLNMG